MTLLAGGRYNELSLAIGWRNAVPAVGWAAGLERIVLLQSAIDVSWDLVPRCRVPF